MSEKKGPSFFEGTEKKLEILVKDKDLRSLGKEFWTNLISRSKCNALSCLKGSHCDAYLLSESSLFVWKDRMTMITCGNTTLIEATLYFLREIPEEHIEFLIYERKNEYFPFQQSSDFYEDIKKLHKYIPGEVFLFGEKAGHHLLLFHSQKPFNMPKQDVTFELLMYDFISKKLGEIFLSLSWDKEKVRSLTHLDSIFPGFQKNEYFFHPNGYSINALKGENYYTIHITQDTFHGIYISLETNRNLFDKSKGEKMSVLSSLLSLFQPKSFDLISVESLSSLKLASSLKKEGVSSLNFQSYIGTSPSFHWIGKAYKVEFCHFFHRDKELKTAKRIAFPL